MSAPELPARIQSALAGVAHQVLAPRDQTPCIEVERASLRTALEHLHRAGFVQNTFVTAIDRHPAEPRYEVNHQFLSLEPSGAGARVRVVTRVRSDDAIVPTCIDLWPGAAYSERECFDMFGIRFEGHEGLKRLLMPDEYGWHPLRKDFPHHGIEPDRLYRAWDRARRAGVGPEGAKS